VSQRPRSTSAQRGLQNGRLAGADGRLQIGHRAAGLGFAFRIAGWLSRDKGGIGAPGLRFQFPVDRL
jgi:hypothetical protein